MDKAKDFETYFSPASGLTPPKLARMQLTRKLVHEIYPDVTERVGWAMPGFYPKGATKATQQLFMVMANAKWLGLYGTPGFDANGFANYGVKAGKGSLQVPYDLPENIFRDLLSAVIAFNLTRHGV